MDGLITAAEYTESLYHFVEKYCVDHIDGYWSDEMEPYRPDILTDIVNKMSEDQLAWFDSKIKYAHGVIK